MSPLGNPPCMPARHRSDRFRSQARERRHNGERTRTLCQRRRNSIRARLPRNITSVARMMPSGRECPHLTHVELALSDAIVGIDRRGQRVDGAHGVSSSMSRIVWPFTVKGAGAVNSQVTCSPMENIWLHRLSVTYSGLPFFLSVTSSGLPFLYILFLWGPALLNTQTYLTTPIWGGPGLEHD